MEAPTAPIIASGSFCNMCWTPLTRGRFFRTICGHLFCEKDAFEVFAKRLECPACRSPLPGRGDITEIDPRVDKDPAASSLLQSYLVMDPLELHRLSGEGMELKLFQQTQFAERQLHLRKTEATSAQRKADEQGRKIVELQNTVNTLSNKYSSAQRDLSAKEELFKELRSQYDEMSRKKSAFEKLYLSLRSQTRGVPGGRGAGGAGAGMGSGGGLGILSPASSRSGGSPRAPSSTDRNPHPGASPVTPFTAGQISVPIASYMRTPRSRARVVSKKRENKTNNHGHGPGSSGSTGHKKYKTASPQTSGATPATPHLFHRSRFGRR